MPSIGFGLLLAKGAFPPLTPYLVLTLTLTQRPFPELSLPSTPSKAPLPPWPHGLSLSTILVLNEDTEETPRLAIGSLNMGGKQTGLST